jgi:hypothetical protein
MVVNNLSPHPAHAAQTGQGRKILVAAVDFSDMPGMPVPKGENSMNAADVQRGAVSDIANA